jgi:hypothetical protein
MHVIAPRPGVGVDQNEIKAQRRHSSHASGVALNSSAVVFVRHQAPSKYFWIQIIKSKGRLRAGWRRRIDKT